LGDDCGGSSFWRARRHCANPPGANPEAGAEDTQVRMMAETILLEIQPGASVDSLGQAKVTADFTMRNLGSETERMAIRFPLSINDGFGRFPEIRGLQIKVNGRIVSTRRVMQADPLYAYDQVPWAEFDVTFPAGQDVLIQVIYTVDGTGEYPFVSYGSSHLTVSFSAPPPDDKLSG
jgi:hypothetical protein